MEALEKRKKICGLIEKMRKYPDFTQRLELKDLSGFRTEEAMVKGLPAYRKHI